MRRFVFKPTAAWTVPAALVLTAGGAWADNQLIQPAQIQLVIDWASFTSSQGQSI